VIARAATAALLATAVLAPGASAATKNTDKTLRADLVRLARRAGGSGGFTVIDDRTRRTVAESAGTTARPLGSTAKILTTATAVQTLLTPRRTRALTAAPLDAASGTLGGDLLLVGDGDPLLGEAQLQQLAAQVQARGIRVITGSVAGDGSAFDALTGGPATHGAFDLNFNGSVGALTYDRGRQAPGGPLQPDPARAAAYRFDDILEARGIVIRGVPKAGTAPATGVTELGTVETGLEDIVKDINKVSDDFAAEVLAKGLAVADPPAPPATTAAGAAVIRQFARQAYGVTVFPADGSGVDPATKGAPRQLARFIRRVRQYPWISRSLPIAGVDGTLATRLTTAPARGTCHAKTGSLPQSRDSSLAGWCRVHGRILDFSIQRVHVTSQPAAKAAEDAMVQRIAASRRR
jgi:D-alanyl-D-alanine carboxypeptidase/D-alanyl-D-alanine-endopeptidase (penicillin-binding protein 4)